MSNESEHVSNGHLPVQTWAFDTYSVVLAKSNAECVQTWSFKGNIQAVSAPVYSTASGERRKKSDYYEPNYHSSNRIYQIITILSIATGTFILRTVSLRNAADCLQSLECLHFHPQAGADLTVLCEELAAQM